MKTVKVTKIIEIDDGKNEYGGHERLSKKKCRYMDVDGRMGMLEAW